MSILVTRILAVVQAVFLQLVVMLGEMAGSD
jgi:hypothetical protein